VYRRRQTVQRARLFGTGQFDIRLPLVANYNGTQCNVSIRSLDIPGNKITFFAPVFEGVKYRHVKPVGDYAQRFLAAIPQDIGDRVLLQLRAQLRLR
jgi:hypothetical protein